jgi:hypothetical protein
MGERWSRVAAMNGEDWVPRREADALADAADIYAVAIEAAGLAKPLAVDTTGTVAERFAVAAVQAHRDGWYAVNSKNPDEARPADRKLWAAVLGSDR